MQKIVINVCHGGFGLSEEATARYKQLEGITDPDWWAGSIERDDPRLIQVVEEFGPLVNDRCSELRIVEIPDDVQWHIAEYDGYEHVAEDHRTWP
jgi:hypothetical protein